MRNPSRKPQLPSWREVVATIYRGIRSGRDAGGSGRKAQVRWVAGGLLCVALAAGISLARHAGKKRDSAARKTESPISGTVSARNTGEKTAKSIISVERAPKPEKRHSSSVAVQSARKTKGSETPSPTLEVEQRAAVAAPPGQIVLAPPVSAPDAKDGVKEDSDVSRERGSWFFDQRAYPNKHIPEGALQRAIEQRDAMKAQQQLAGGPQTGANGIISFPGDALWHLMGPQPVNEPFTGTNTGYPTASGRVTAIAVDPSTPSTVYIGGAAGGVWKTTDGGTTWTPLTDSQPSLAVGSIAIDPNSCSPAPCSTIYVGTGEDNFNGDAFYGAGVLKSTNGGSTWTQSGGPFAGALSPTFGGAKIGAIAVQPGNSSIVLAAAYFFDGNDPRGGIYRSTDGGQTWALPTTGGKGSAGTGVVFESSGVGANPPIAWAALGDVFSGASSNGIWKSTDLGVTWTLQTSVLPTVNVGRITLGYAANTTGATATLYAAIADSSTTSAKLLGLFKTTNGGTTWSAVTGPSVTGGFCASQCFYDMAIGVQPTNASVVVLGGGPGPDNFTSLFESQDGGTTWTPSGTLGSPSPGNFANGSTTTHVHVDTHAVVFAPNGGTLYVGDDGGIWSTTTPTPASTVSPTWTDLNGGLAITQFYPGPSAGISDENFGLGGTQDNDTEIFTGALGWTNAFTCGDGGSTAIDPAVPTTVYTTCDRGAQHIVNKSVFNGALLPNPTFSGADTGITHGDRMQFIPPLTIDENNPNTLYFGTFRVYQTNDGAATWTPISADLGAGVGNITTFDVAHQSSSIVVAGTSNGKVWESLNATAGALSTWTEIDNGQLPNRHITAVRTERSDSTGNIVFATLSGFGACSGCGATPGHVFVTTNATSGAPTWTNISGDLPDIPVNDLIVFHQGSPTFDALYIATDVGVFSCTNPSATLCANWTVIGDGLPNSPVLGLAMRRPSRILHAATHGRSMWQIQLTDVSPGPLASITSVTPATAFVGDPATAVTINGFNFSANTAVFLNGVSVGTPTFVSTTQLNVTLASTFFQTGGVFPINLMDTAGVDPNFVLGASGAPFTVMNPILGTPTLTNPTTTAGTPYTMHFTGSNFVNSTTVTLTTFGNFTLGGTASSNGTVFDVQVPASLLITAMPVSGTITNPVPGGGPTPAFPFNFTVNAGTIVFSPNPIALTTFLGTTSFPVMNVAVINTSASSVNITAQSITGTNAANFSFAAPTSGTTCNFPTSGQTGTGTITLAANGTCNFGITYTAATPPGNAVSNATLNVTDTAAGSPQTAPIKGTPLPATVLLAPVNFGAVAVGTTSTTMNATLANFSGSSISVTSAFTVSGTNLADFNIVPFVANGDGNAACPAAVPFPLASGASCDVSLAFTPSLPAGNETAQLNVTASVAITTSTPNLIGIGIEITSISPSIVATGGPAFTLTVNGGGFAPSAVVNVGPNGTNPRLTTFVNANQLLASIPASDIAAAGTLPISVTTPNPGGTTSEPKTLFIAQAPTATNDNINFAVNASTTPFRVTQDTTQATTDTGGIADPTPCAPSSKARSVWFKFVAPASGRVVADTRFSSYTTILSAWTGTPGSLVAVASACASGNISGAKPQSSIGFSVSSGTTYFLMVTDANTTGPGGTLTFSLDFASAAPANDPFASPTNIASAPFSTTENTILATPNTGATDPTPSCAPAGAASGGMANSVWFSYTPSSNGTISTDTLTSPYDTILTVVTGSPGSFTQIACNDNASAGIAQSQVSFAATSGTHYFFMISSVLGDGGTTSFHLNFTASVGNPVPTLTSFSPANAAAGGAAFALTVNGTNFVSGATGTFNGNARTVTFVSATQVTMAVTAADIATAGSFPVIISNPGPGGGASAPLNFQVNNPAATLTSLSPSSTTVGGVAFNLIITGSNFVSGATGTFNGNARTVTFNSSTQVTMAVTAPDIATAGSFAVNVSNPAPGGGSNGALLFNVNNVVPTITTIAPTSATVGGATFNLTVTGTGYISGSAVKFNGTSVTTTFNSSTQLTGAISSALIASVGSFPVTVTNAAPGGGVSNSVNFNVTAGAPATMTANAGTTPQSATISTAFANPLAVTVKDAGSNPVSGVNVTFTAPGSGASGTFSNSTAAITVATNASGVASAPFTANATAGGPYTVTAAASGLTTVNFSLTNTAGAAKTMTANAGTTPQSATISTAFANPLAVTVKDAGSNPVSGVNVTFTAPGSGASGVFSNSTATITVATNSSGVASAPFTANATAGGPYTVTAAATGLTTVNFSLTNTAGAPATMTANAGTTPQSATISTAFANPLAVTVKDAGSNPVSGVNVTFTAPGSGASGIFSNNTATITVPTNASGVASAPFTANATAGGPYTVTAAASGLTTVNFSLTNTAGAAKTMTANAGTTPQSATISTAFANPLAVTVKDSGSNPVSGVNVTFTAPSSGASGVFSNSTATITVATNASGVASAPFTANATAGGPYTVTAAATGLTTVNFSLTNLTATPASMTANAGTTPQSATISTAFANPLAVTVKDAGSNPVSGVNVTFTAPGSGASGTFSNSTAAITVATNASGVASAPFTANATAGGPYTVTAAATGLTTINFSLTNTVGAPKTMTANAGTTPQSAAISTAFANSLAVTVKDSGSNPVSGVNVTFTAPGSGASGVFSNSTATITVATNASGVVSAAFTANATAGGPYTVTAAATGLTTVNFSLTNTAGIAVTMGANAGATPQSTAISTAFTNPLAVTVKDAGSNPVSGVNVTFTAPGSGASGTFSNSTATITVATNASGVASAPFTADATAGGPYTVTAAATGLTTVNFSLTNLTAAPASMTANGGTTPQSATIITAFANPLAVTVKDAGSNPVSGVNVTFTAPGSGASGIFSNSTATITVATNASGVASAPFTANSTAGGPYMVTAAAAGLTTVNFSLTNTAGPPATMTANAGTTPQSTAIGTAFTSPLGVTVKDSSSNPVSGVNVTFTAPGSGASGTFSNSTATIVVATNASGVASAPFTANVTIGGPYTVTAAATGLTTVNFSLTNTAGPPATMTANAGTTPQSATISTAFTNALAVTVKDAGSNPVSGVNVTFTAPGSGASGIFSNSTTTIVVATNASGVASAPFTANATAGGPYTVTAAATGLTTVNFSLTNTVGPPATMTANAGTTPQSAAISAAFANPLAVTVKDAGSNPVSGVNVTFTAPGSGASGTFSNSTATITVATNASGVASAPFTANSTAGGPYTVTAAVTGLTTVNFSLTNTAGPAATMTANAGTTPQSATISTAFANPLAVTVKDSGSNPVSGVNVTFTAPGSGASGVFSNSTATITVPTNASGVASAPFTANSTAGGPYTVTAAATGLTTVNFSLTNKVGAPTTMTANAGATPQSATISTVFANALAVTVKDSGSNPVSGVNVTFTAPGSGASGVFSNSTATITLATNASGVASAPFTANATAGGPYTVTAGATGLTTVNFALTNNNPMPAITPPLSPASANAGGASFALTINGTKFVAGATVTFGSNPALTPTTITSTQIVVTIPAADFTTGGTPNVTVINPGPGGGASNAVAFTVNNPVPTVTSINAAGKNHAPGGAALTLTVNGTNFVSTSVINFIVGTGTAKAEPTTFVSATQLTAAIPASDVSAAGTASITVTNPSPGGGTTTANTSFTVDGYTLAGPATPPSVKAGQPASIQITLTPTANGFANAVTFSVSGLPGHSGPPTFSPTSVTPGSSPQTVTLMIPTTAGGAMPPAAPIDPPTSPLLRWLPLLWLATLLAALCAARLARRAPQLRRYGALLPLVFLLITGAALAGCIGGKSGTPKGPAQLTITATSGTLSQTTNVTLTVN